MLKGLWWLLERTEPGETPEGCGARGQWCRGGAHCLESRAVNPTRNTRDSRAVSPSPWAGITGYLCCAAAIPELRKGSRGGSSLTNAGLAWDLGGLGCVCRCRLTRGYAQGLFLQQQELQLL